MIFPGFLNFLNKLWLTKKKRFCKYKISSYSDLSKILPRKYCYLLFLAKAETNLKRLSISVLKLIIQDILSIHHH